MNKILKRVFTSEIKGIDDKEQTITAYISTSARDRHNESLDPSGVDLSHYKKNPIVLWAHDYSLPPIGKSLWVKRDGEGILAKVKFASTEFAQEIFQLYKEGFMKAFSVGFIPKEMEEGDGKKTPRMTYRKWEMLEYSAVPVPANPEALTLAIQKGILKTESIKTSMEKGVEDEPEETWEIETKEVKKEESQPLKSEESSHVFDDLMAENSFLELENEALKKENELLRIKLFFQLSEREKKFSEMAVDKLAQRTVELIDGAIRKAKGKV